MFFIEFSKDLFDAEGIAEDRNYDVSGDARQDHFFKIYSG